MMNDSTSSRLIAIRSLRRRLWHALQQEDVDTAIRAYTATRADYEAWILQEEQARLEQEKREEQARLVQQRREARPSLKKLGSLKMIRRNSNKQNTITVQSSTPARMTKWDDEEYLLVKEMDPSNVFVADDFLSPDAPFETETVVNDSLRSRSRRKSKGPRFAGFWMRRAESQSDYEDQVEDDQENDELFTTPLHEAARLGSAKLVRLFLEHGGLPNLKNGMQRTALHMAAGGLTAEEENLLVSRATEEQKDATLLDEIGIRAPVEDTPEASQDETEDHPAAVGAKKAALHLRRLFALGNHPDKSTEDSVEEPLPPPPFDAKRFNKLVAQRMDTVLAILSWCHPDDGSDSANDGPSINSVDARGRTALHYAAELGRADICMAVVSSFGAILTIVDESSRTPCELAGEQSHSDLAAQLEARALLYSDPYGVDDELMASVLSEERDGGNSDDPNRARKKLAVPFSWFETLSTVQVRQERNTRTEKAMVELQKILAERQEQEKANEVMFHYNVNDSLDSAPRADIVDLLSNEDTDKKDASKTTAEDVHMLAGIQEDHPPSPPSPSPKILEEATVEPEAIGVAIGVDVKLVSDDVAPDTKALTVDSEYARMLDSLQESHVERFLAFHNWQLGKALMEFKKDPTKAFEDAGVSVETNRSSLKWEEMTPQTCLICFEEFAPGSPEWRNFRGCDHGFCTQCLSEYIVDCARSRSGGITVICPHHECNVPLTQSELQSLVPNPTVYESLLEAADENCVASSSDLKFCPHPGCEGVVHRLVPPIVAQEGFDHDIINNAGAVCVSFPEGDEDAPLTYEGVRDRRYIMTRGSTQPHTAHRFCFGCGDANVHWPVPCETLEQWKTKVRDEISEIDEDGGEDGTFEDVAQRLWMKANTRPCPQCQAPIEKNEGCNHMTCTNRLCRHEFCWICRKDWKLHNTDTGGFFRCNRWEGEADHEFYDGEEHQPRPRAESNGDGETSEAGEAGYGSALHSARVAAKKATEMKRFLHHFSRWSAHKESAALERNMADTVCTRLAPVVEAAIEFNGAADFDFGGKGLSFVHAAFSELLECRSLLQHSYAFAFFRYPTLYYIRRNRVVKLRQREKATFEQFQSELEMMTEQMSDIAARTHLRATQTQIMFLTSEAAEKRRDFSSFLITVLADERREKAASERQEGETETPSRTIPPPIDVSGIIERLQSRVPLRNEHDDMDSDDGAGVSYPFASRHQHDEDEESLEDTALQEALQASLVTFQAESASTLNVAGTDSDDNGNGEEDEAAVGVLIEDWACEACTYVNSQGTSCAMCGTARSGEDANGEDANDGADANDEHADQENGEE